jgi:trehalose 6-phosphate phosphatase
MAKRWPERKLAPFVEDPAHAGIFCDFDGTLADIVLDPAGARPRPGAVEVLAELSEVFARVGVLSGRPLSFLEPYFGPEVVLSGLYGIEVIEDGDRRDHPQAGAWREVVDDIAATAKAHGPEGMRVESKGLSITFHYREHPECADKVGKYAQAQAARSGLEQRPARMSVELHPPIPADKGSALHEAAEGLRSVLYIGDDVGDLPAFDALDELGDQGVTVLRVAVRSDEASDELLERADLVLDGPEGVVDLLTKLAKRVGPKEPSAAR